MAESWVSIPAAVLGELASKDIAPETYAQLDFANLMLLHQCARYSLRKLADRWGWKNLKPVRRVIQEVTDPDLGWVNKGTLDYAQSIRLHYGIETLSLTTKPVTDRLQQTALDSQSTPLPVADRLHDGSTVVADRLQTGTPHARVSSSPDLDLDAEGIQEQNSKPELATPVVKITPVDEPADNLPDPVTEAQAALFAKEEANAVRQSNRKPAHPTEERFAKWIVAGDAMAKPWGQMRKLVNQYGPDLTYPVMEYMMKMAERVEYPFPYLAGAMKGKVTKAMIGGEYNRTRPTEEFPPHKCSATESRGMSRIGCFGCRHKVNILEMQSGKTQPPYADVPVSVKDLC